MPELVIYDRNQPDEVSVVWPPQAQESKSIQEARSYILELRGVEFPDAIDLFVDQVPVEALRSPNSSTARWEWQPGFYAGSVTASLRWKEGRQETFEIVTNPDLKKLTRADFDMMVREILEDTFALFSLSSFRTGVSRGAGDVPPLARLEFIRSRVEELEQVIQQIDTRPIRILRSTGTKVPLHQAKGITGPELLRSMRGTRLHPLTSEPVPGTSPGFLPVHVLKARKTDGLNIREHQDIKAALRNWSAWLDVVAARLAGGPAPNPEQAQSQHLWSNRCRALSRRLKALLKLPLFADVSERAAPVVLTSIYRRVVPYRRFFELYRDMNLGIANISGDFLQMPLARTFDLYELWCFLRLVRAAVNRLRLTELDVSHLFKSSGQSGALTIQAKSVFVPLAKGYALAFQPSYREYWLNSALTGSLSRTMRPDISLRVPGPPQEDQETERLMVLDAKYRINHQLDDALTSLHTYRDALVKADAQDQTKRIVMAAYLLTPHLPVVGKEWKQMDMPNRLFHPDYRTIFKFGAICLKPGQQLAEIEVALENLLNDAGVSLLDTNASQDIED